MVGVPRKVQMSVLVLLIPLLCIDVADGFFVSSANGKHWVKGGAARAGQVEEAAVLKKGPYDEDPDSDPERDIATTYSKSFPGGGKGLDEQKYPVIAALHRSTKAVVGNSPDVWWKDWKIWVGSVLWLGVWLKWLVLGHEDLFHWRILFVFGINILILHHLEFSENLRWGMCRVSTLLSAQAIFESFVWWKREIQDDKSDELLALTMYLDMTLPLLQILVVFIAQTAVFWFFFTSILGNLDFEHVNYAFWLVAFLGMQMTMIFCRGEDSVLGFAFPCHDVHRLWVNSDTLTLKLQDKESQPFTVSKANILFRGVLGFFCNAILREIMAYTIPLMLMSFSEPMDFVVYCVGVNFICTVDDMKEKRFTLTGLTSRRLQEGGV